MQNPLLFTLVDVATFKKLYSHSRLLYVAQEWDRHARNENFAIAIFDEIDTSKIVKYFDSSVTSIILSSLLLEG